MVSKNVLFVGAVLAVFGASSGSTRVALQTRPQFQKIDGHISPVSIAVTFGDGTSRSYLLTGQDWNFSPARLSAVNESQAGVNFWFDAISEIVSTDDQGMIVVLKSGTERHVGYTSSSLQVNSPDGGDEKVDLKKVRSVKFLSPARKDGAGNAMFSHWRFSPYTGERLAAE